MDTTIKFPNITNTLQINGCHFGIKPPAWAFPKHHHHYYELLYCWEGNILQEINGLTVQLSQGDWLLINSGVRHEIMNHSSSHVAFFNVHFDLDDTEIRKQLGIYPFKLISRQEAEQSKLPELLKHIEALMQHDLLHKQIEDATDSKTIELDFISRISLQANTLLLVGEVLSFLKRSEDVCKETTVSSAYATDVAHAIEERLVRYMYSDHSIAAISAELNLSRYQCSKIFVKVYGISPRQYISRLKLNKAKELLVGTNLTIEAISEQLGFHSASHFSRQFRRWTGCSPNHFRPKHTPLHPNGM